MRRKVKMMRHRGDIQQATLLEQWLVMVIGDYAENILEFGELEAQVWGRLRVPNYENALDKQIAATALTHDLMVVTRNVEDFADTGVKLLNPFSK
jgi:hypothetical protein